MVLKSFPDAADYLGIGRSRNPDMSNPAHQTTPPPPGADVPTLAATPAPPPPGHETAEEPKGKREHRRYERKPLSREALVTELLGNGSLGQPWHCQTMDLSRGGMALVSRRMVRVGTNLFIHLEGTGSTRTEPLYGTVMHFRYLKDGTHLLGVQFGTPPVRRSIQEWMAAQRRP